MRTLPLLALLSTCGFSSPPDGPAGERPALMVSDFQPLSGRGAPPANIVGDEHETGPWAVRLAVATSRDGLDFSPTGETIVDQAGVPGAILGDDGRLRVYYIAWQGGENFTAVALYDDEWGWAFRRVEIEGAAGDDFADPSLVRLADGRYRMYYTNPLVSAGGNPAAVPGPRETRGHLQRAGKGKANPSGPRNPAPAVKPEKPAAGGPGPGPADGPPSPDGASGGGDSAPPPSKAIYSAISDDGVRFTREPGTRVTSSQSPDGHMESALVIQTGATWRLFAGPMGQLTATSSDGLDFQIGPPLEVDGRPFMPLSGAAVDGGYRLYGTYEKGSLRSAFSKDGRTWTAEAGERHPAGTCSIGNCEHTIARMGDEWWMIYNEPAL